MNFFFVKVTLLVLEKFPRLIFLGEFPPIFSKYQGEQGLTVLSYSKQIKSKVWLYDRKSLGRERNTRFYMEM